MKELYTKIFMFLVISASPLLVYYDRKFELFLWRTDTALGGMEKLNFLGNTEFISIPQYLFGMVFYSAGILGIAFYCWLIIFIYIGWKENRK
ncbi:hypothetical protein [Aliarcobacter butzleri]|uniref:hypothetical protein n=1 Tax=Aliarcobacter butzleri TaxID=28197 RepID=UPI00126A101E|nr:hypothetical protein [Aliarcobacter butzleri]